MEEENRESIIISEYVKVKARKQQLTQELRRKENQLEKENGKDSSMDIENSKYQFL